MVDNYSLQGKRFDKIEDALRYVNEQLSLKGYYTNGSDLNSKKIELNGEIDDKKLVINTLSRLLNEINNKNKLLSETAQENRLIKQKLNTVAKQKEANDKELIKLHLPTQKKVTKPTVPTQQVTSANFNNNSNNSNVNNMLTKTYKVKLNKLQSTIDELRNKLSTNSLRRSGNDDLDLTWGTNSNISIDEHDILEPEMITPDKFLESSGVLRKYNELVNLRLNLIDFISMVNKITYSKNVLNLETFEISGFIDQSSDSKDTIESKNFNPDITKNDPEIYELVTDYYEILRLSNKSI
ncbi:hypothetical protein Kpol_543p28 [Vanderwaltozyma polyspora DSM 70294]|uniref:Uncharacterized protein n=1 Tax=Vanderwaltozyma polyspora (strain ATCC 22028 / DSM 70294 / BCRC 21397 / CBS 2163 / NBRC 10782 / NRRL Y-8283 / UCD 57-17) TaxID=436907 RepID=A7THN2_VANPO|nr:uncharacterized protein Kpol_543p28 [Vanderwaltozyma polyspora DSM 70294]EDO18198.1 hypothetical protein Kpol_543p28 [Vanderwaltozyma polyspora DSM 70294]